MSRRAWIYIGSVLLVGIVLAGLAASQFIPTPTQWATFSALLILATMAQLFRVEAPSHTLYYATPIFFFAGILLLQPFLLVCMVVLALIVEWIKERLTDSAHLRFWYLQPFNMAMYSIAALSAQWVYRALDSQANLLHTTSAFIAVTSAALTYVIVNHILLGVVLMLARGKSLRESAALDQEGLLIELILVCVGFSVALVYTLNPWLIIPTLAPLVMMYQALRIPQLKHEAHIDAKTGLLNVRPFTEQYSAAFDRATRLNQPLAFIMADLDLLRTINNTHGHLAGDVVLTGVAQTIRATLRDEDLAGRFGGEEFAIVLPNTSEPEAWMIAERIREAVEAQRFAITTHPAPIQATMSFGIACFPADADTPTALIEQADAAVYHAKNQGRNRVVCVADILRAVDLPQVEQPEPLHPTYRAAFARPRLSNTTTLAPPDATVTRERPVNPQPAVEQHQSVQVPVAEVTAASVEQAGKLVQSRWLALVVAVVIVIGGGVASVGWIVGTPFDISLVVLLMLLAVVAELLQVDLYGTGTISVSLAAIYAAALLTGIPGLSCVSAAVALSAAVVLTRTNKRRPALYKIAFNWAVHILAGTPIVLIYGALAMPLQLVNLFAFIVPTLLTVLIYYAIETGLIATVIGLSMGISPRIAWQERYQWLGQHYVLLGVMGLFLSMAFIGMGIGGLVVFWLPILALRFAQQQYVERTTASMNELERMNRELRTANKSIYQLNEELFSTLARFFDARDPLTAEHSATVARYAQDLAEELGLNVEQIQQARQAGYLHDIGKIAIPEAILFKQDKLTAMEYEQVKMHTLIGAELLAVTHGLRHLAPLVRHHHERWDGTGYPDRISGEDIPLLARILAVCDAVEAMASDRPYQRGKAVAEVIVELETGAGMQFDPTIVQLFLNIIRRSGPSYITNSAQRVQALAQPSLTSVKAWNRVPPLPEGETRGSWELPVLKCEEVLQTRA